MFSYLVMTAGSRVGTQFALAESKQNRIGRGLDCDVILVDPLSSRVHAIVVCQRGEWWLRDAGSRNGTFVNGQKADEARLLEGVMVKVGSTEFEFRQSDSRLSESARLDRTQTIITDRSVALTEPAAVFGVEALRDHDRANDFLTLHQLSLKLLGCTDPDDVVRVSLELLRDRTKATVVGFLWVSDDGQLKPKLVIPEDAAGTVQLSGELTELVIRQGKAIWIDNQKADTAHVLQHYADAICVPLVHESSTLGALHVYLDRGRFKQSDFEVAMPLSNILTVALARARREAILRIEQQRLADKAAVSDELLGESRPMLDLKSRIARVARATGCVLIRGESGVGKELVARAMHRASGRSDRPMLSVNCAAIPRDLMESQLFGHKRGAFTGADADHAGLFQQAHTGTLFLDEVGEMTLDGQAKLLRILEGHPFLPVGATKEVNADVRVIAATNRDLSEFVRAGQFREDLYYRLSVFELYIPPLRERGSDIELLIQHFLEHFKRQHGRPSLALSPDAKTKLLGYAWPGNVRQLRNVVDSAVVMSEGNVILPDDLGLRDTSQSDQLESLRIDFWERKLIQEALKRTGGNIPEASKLLGLGRATLYRKVEEYGIDRK